ncbi:MAG: LCP family protein [Loigolactobacillus coryniformis]|jgi:LCP family protein required for cell wall assembly|uniref:LCP family protein n=1 Tax=Loigolactobacillus coryniformis TaxID=1610 RepID=UPI0026474815|nr:LCP family protein [Loigolactobacillus coryniformis]MDN5954019.1 LCP family protein [Loigolactobacillus coryniformis]
MPENEESNTRSGRKPPKKSHPLLKIILLIISVAVFLTGIFAYKLYSHAGDTITGMHASIGNASQKIQQKKPFSVLLLGADTGADGRKYKGNSDTIILATVNPAKNRVKLVSIPRDTLAELVGAKPRNMQKINAAYNYGGTKMAAKSVSKLLNVPIDYYMTINMGALKTVVDDVGGIDVNIPFSFTSVWTGGQKFKKGVHHLNGTQALAYSRMRHEDPRGDYGRQLRQQQVIRAVLKKATQPKILLKYKKITRDLAKNMRTDLTFADIETLALNYRQSAGNIKSDQLQGKDAWINGSSYQIASTKELNRVSKMLRHELGLTAEKVDNAEVYQNELNPYFDGIDNQMFYISNDFTTTIAQ